MAYAYYVPLIVQSGQVTGSVTDFVALLDHTFAPWKSVSNGGHINNTVSGLPADFNIYADIGLTTELYFETISWDPTTGAIIAWVQTDVATSTTVYVAYGDPSVTTYQGNNYDTWTGIGFVAVYHMDLLAGGLWYDIPFNNNMANTNGTQVAGWIADAGDFNGTTAYASYSAGIVTAPPLTISCWINPDDLGPSKVIASILVSAGVWNGFVLVLEDSPNDNVQFFTASNNFAAIGVASIATTATGTWQHVAGVTSGVASRYAYLDGVASAEDTTSVTPTVTPDNFDLAAARTGGSTGLFFDGIIDEVRIHNVARSADWLEAEYNSQNDATAFWVLGSETPVGAVTGPSYYGYVGYYQ